MRPVPIPDRRIWTDDRGQPLPRRTLGAPKGHEGTVPPVEILVEHSTLDLGPQCHVLLELEDGDLQRLTVDPHLWLTFWGGVVPFRLTVPDQ